MRKPKTFLSLTTGLLTILLMVGCNGLSSYNTEFPVVDSATGNLVIANKSGIDLNLYSNGEFLTRIPEYLSELVVDVPVSGDQQEMELHLYRSEDCQTRSEPSSELLYRSWNVVLTSEPSLSDRRTWNISSPDVSSGISTGALSLYYGSGSDYFVRVYIGGPTGSRIATLSSQAGEVLVGLDFGTYVLSYEYVYDSGQGTGATVIGTIDTETVMGETVPIYAVLNTHHDTWSIQVPHFEATGPQGDAPYSTLEVTNSTALPLRIMMDGQPIEQSIYLGDGSRDSASVISAGDTVEFIIPAGSHVLEARNLSGTSLKWNTCDLDEDETFSWIVSS